MDDPKKKIPAADLRQTLPTMDSGVDPSSDTSMPEYVESEHDAPTLPTGTRVGKYTIERVLGVGGMGAVYLATQSKPQRQVALKLIRPGVLSAKSMRRFDLEAEILGRLQHTNIAQIHEAGIDSNTGSPYFAMEYVDGQELSDYIFEHRLSVRATLELFIKLCDAIQHAHARGVIHRDLKPGNVLVLKEGEPKVLDFGVARAADTNTQAATLQTNVGQLVGTLYYMSPEQAIGDTQNLDTRSDVYALGVVLYEMLTSEIPYELRDKALHEAVRIIQETNPTRLSKIDPVLKGDIEIIVGKALAKDKDQRYQTVADFSADIRRLLSNQPILARPPSIVYKTTKFVRRNMGLTIAAACIAVLFAIAIGFLINQRISKIEARQLALDNMLTTLNLMDVQKGLGPDLTKRLLDMYSDHGETIFSGDRQRLAVFYTGLGRAYHGYEDYRSALASYEKAYEILRKEHRAPHPAIADALHKVASAEFYIGNFNRARAHYESTLEMREQLYTPSDPEAAETARTMDHLGSTCAKLGDFETALTMYTQAKELREQIFGSGSLEVAMSNNSIAWFYVQQDQYEIAEPIYREALEILQALPEDDSKPLWVARAMHSLGSALIHLERYEEAQPLLSDALELKQALLASNKPSVALTLESLAEVCYHRGLFDQAEGYAVEAVLIREEISDRKLRATQELLRIIRAKKNPEQPSEEQQDQGVDYTENEALQASG